MVFDETKAQLVSTVAEATAYGTFDLSLTTAGRRRVSIFGRYELRRICHRRRPSPVSTDSPGPPQPTECSNVMQDQAGAHAHDARPRRRHAAHVRDRDHTLCGYVSLLILAPPRVPRRLLIAVHAAHQRAVPDSIPHGDRDVQCTYGLSFPVHSQVRTFGD